jgi:outer membrane biosynthesis protein TonB
LERPGSSLAASIAVHAAVILGVLGYGLLGYTRAPMNVETAVPVSIVSDTVIEAAAADNPDDELVTGDAATAPVAETPPEPAPPEPAPPRPTPTPAPVKKATPPRPTPPRPTPPRPQPPQPPERGFLEGLIEDPAPRTGPGRRPPTGQTGVGAASQATGPQITAIFNQVYPNWILPCDIPGANALRIQMDVTLDEQGRITAGPTLIGARSDPVYRAAADGAVRAIRQTAPFDVPTGFPGGRFRPTFITERACRGR